MSIQWAWGVFALNLVAFILNLIVGNVFFIVLNGAAALVYGIYLCIRYKDQINLDLSWIRKLDFKSKR